jgi:hypothetical protein
VWTQNHGIIYQLTLPVLNCQSKLVLAPIEMSYE